MDELPKDARLNYPLHPILCEEGCADVSDIRDLYEERIAKLEGLAQLSLEEDARMAERFRSLHEGQERMERKLEEIGKEVRVVHEVAQKNSHDLNNGLKSHVKAIARRVGVVERELEEHERQELSPEERRLEIDTQIDERAKNQRENKHRTIEVGVGLMLLIVTLAQWKEIWSFAQQIFGG